MKEITFKGVWLRGLVNIMQIATNITGTYYLTSGNILENKESDKIKAYAFAVGLMNAATPETWRAKDTNYEMLKAKIKSANESNAIGEINDVIQMLVNSATKKGKIEDKDAVGFIETEDTSYVDDDEATV